MLYERFLKKIFDFFKYIFGRIMLCFELLFFFCNKICYMFMFYFEIGSIFSIFLFGFFWFWLIVIFLVDFECEVYVSVFILEIEILYWVFYGFFFVYYYVCVEFNVIDFIIDIMYFVIKYEGRSMFCFVLIK